jgi:hypothetical protein
MDQRLILGADRAREHAPAILHLEVPLPLRRIWPHREVCRTRAAELSRRGSDCDPRIDRQHAALVDQQRIDVEFADLQNIGGHLRQLDQHHGHRVLFNRGNVPIGARRC